MPASVMKNRCCFNITGTVGQSHTQKMKVFYLFSHYKLKTLQGCGILPAKTACKESEARRGKIERQRAERGITEKALERDGERWEEGGLCTSLLLLALLFLNGLVLLVGRLITRALRLK